MSLNLFQTMAQTKRDSKLPSIMMMIPKLIDYLRSLIYLQKPTCTIIVRTRKNNQKLGGTNLLVSSHTKSNGHAKNLPYL